MKNNLGNKKTMAKNLKYYMELHDVDRIELCKNLGIKYTTLTDWLKANTYPRIDKIEIMANYFGISKADLVENHDDDTGISPIAIKFSKILKEIPDAEEAMDLYSQLDDVDRSGVRGEMRGLLKNPKYDMDFDSPNLTIAASGLDENTPLSDANKDIIQQALKRMKKK